MLSKTIRTDPNTARDTQVQQLEDQVGEALGAVRVRADLQDLVREHMRDLHSDYLAALDGLTASLRTLGASVRVTFWQHVNPDGTFQKGEPPFATLVAIKPGMNGHFLMPNINSVLNPVQRDDIGFGSGSGQKRLITSASDATSDPEESTPRYPLLVEAFTNPVIIAVTTRTGRMTRWDDTGGATVPLEARAAYSDAALTEALTHIAQGGCSRDTTSKYCHLLDEVISPQAALLLNDRSKKRFGLREELPIDGLICAPETKQLVIETHYPDENGTISVTLTVTPVLDGPFVDAQINALPRRAVSSWEG